LHIIAPSLLLLLLYRHFGVDRHFGSTGVDFVDSNLLLRLRTVLYCFFLAFAAVYV
jgi:hypothetical protein